MNLRKNEFKLAHLQKIPDGFNPLMYLAQNNSQSTVKLVLDKAEALFNSED